jgi:polar amino acid transport system permease protein
MEFDLILRSLPLLLKGALMTVKIVFFSASISALFGLIFGALASEELRVRCLSPCVQWIAFVLRAVPIFVQLLIVYFVFPELVGVNLEPFEASVIALGVCSSGYTCQIVRSGLNAIPHAQWEATFTLGYTKLKSLCYVIFPQLMRNILPALNNELEALLKSTAILSSIGMLELTKMGMNIISREMKPLPIYLTVAVFYLLMSLILNYVTKYFERKLLAVRI